MRWFHIAFLTTGVLIWTHAGFIPTTLALWVPTLKQYTQQQQSESELVAMGITKCNQIKGKDQHSAWYAKLFSVLKRSLWCQVECTIWEWKITNICCNCLKLSFVDTSYLNFTFCKSWSFIVLIRQICCMGTKNLKMFKARYNILRSSTYHLISCYRERIMVQEDNL